MLLDKKVAIVSGAAQGIGKIIAQVLSKEGAIVIICDIQNEKLIKVSTEINKLTKNPVLYYKIDITKKQEIDELVKDIIKKFGKIDILVNNAGILIHALATDMEERDFDKVYEVNVKGPFLFSQAVARVMIPNNYGKIVNIASLSAKKPHIKEIAYCASKSALVSMTRVLALELGKYNINCNTICPGPVITSMLKPRLLANPGMEEKFKEETALKRMVEPVDIANAVLFFASELSKSITGESMLVTAGNMMNL